MLEDNNIDKWEVNVTRWQHLYVRDSQNGKRGDKEAPVFTNLGTLDNCQKVGKETSISQKTYH